MSKVVLHPLQLLPSPEDIHLFTSDYRMSDDALFALAKVLIKYRPKTILETGPGLSTYVILKYFQLTQMGLFPDFISLNHDSEWDKEIKKFLFPRHFTPKWNSVIHTTKLDREGWYDYSFSLNDLGKRDLLVLDGPCDSGARNCLAAQELYRKVVDPKSTVVVVDDTHRPAEKMLCQYFLGMGYYKAESIRDSLYEQRVTTIMHPGTM